MHAKLYFLVLAVIISSNVYAQIGQEITIHNKTFGGYRFEQYGKTLTPKIMFHIMHADSEAHAYMQQARKNFSAGQAVGFLGIGLIGWPFIATAREGQANWAVAGIGAGVLLGTIPFNYWFHENALRAAKAYNSAISNELTGTGLKVQFGLTPHGIGLVLKL